jgi:hypothetical protein
MSDRKSLVILTSPDLYFQTRRVLYSHSLDVPILVWKQGDKIGSRFISNYLNSNEWLTCLSIYNDYIFSDLQIKKIPIIVNIHPALPHLRGRGYDIIPLIDEHTAHGVTLHFVTKSIDAGLIIDVLSEPIPSRISYLDFRQRNQILSLKMLNIFLKLYGGTSSEQFKDKLNGLAMRSEYVWQGDFVNSVNLKAILIKFFQENPRHHMLQQIPSHFMANS